MTLTKGPHIAAGGAASMKRARAGGAALLQGFQLRYVFFLNPAARARLTVPEIPFSAIADAGARMYLGRRIAGEACDGRSAGTATVQRRSTRSKPKRAKP
jgi:hypothetical protein